MRPKLAIVGSHPDTRGGAPWDNQDYDIWVFNEAPQADWCERWDVDFQLHKPEVYMSPNNYSNNNHWPWLQMDHRGKVIYMLEIDDLVPCSRAYPRDEIVASVPGAKREMFTSSPVYALALALYLGYKDIDIWGVDLSSNTEYTRQLPGWMYWIGVADGMGVNLGLHAGLQHFKPTWYGFAGETQLGQEYYKGRVELFEKTMETANADMRKLRDRIDNAIERLNPDKLLDLMIQARDTATEAGILAGALNEAKYYASRLDPIPRQEIERRCAQAQKDGEAHRARMYHSGGQLEYVYNVWRQTMVLQARDQMLNFLAKNIENATNTGICMGAYKENLQNMHELDEKAALL